MKLKRYIKDAAQQISRGDTNQSIYLENLLTATIAELFRAQFPDTPWANDLVFLDTSGDRGAVAVQWNMISDVGSFDTVADDATDLPEIDIEGKPMANRCINVAGVIKYTLQQLAASNMQGMFNIASEKGDAAKRAYSRTLNDYIRVGSAKDSILGVTNAAGRNDMPASGVWAGASAISPSDICDEFAEAYGQIITATRGSVRPDTCVLPQKLEAAFKRQNSLAANDSIEMFLRTQYSGITKWVYDIGMDTSGRDGSAAVCLFNRSPKIIRALLPGNLVPEPPEKRGLSYIIPMVARFAGMAINVPPSITTLYGV